MRAKESPGFSPVNLVDLDTVSAADLTCLASAKRMAELEAWPPLPPLEALAGLDNPEMVAAMRDHIAHWYLHDAGAPPEMAAAPALGAGGGMVPPEPSRAAMALWDTDPGASVWPAVAAVPINYEMGLNVMADWVGDSRTERATLAWVTMLGCAQRFGLDRDEALAMICDALAWARTQRQG